MIACGACGGPVRRGSGTKANVILGTGVILTGRIICVRCAKRATVLVALAPGAVVPVPGDGSVEYERVPPKLLGPPNPLAPHRFKVRPEALAEARAAGRIPPEDDEEREAREAFERRAAEIREIGRKRARVVAPIDERSPVGVLLGDASADVERSYEVADTCGTCGAETPPGGECPACEEERRDVLAAEDEERDAREIAAAAERERELNEKLDNEASRKRAESKDT